MLAFPGPGALSTFSEEVFPVEGGAIVDALDHVAVPLALVALYVRAEPRLPVRVLLVQQREP